VLLLLLLLLQPCPCLSAELKIINSLPTKCLAAEKAK
jgi:hypothetical protein